MIVIKTYSPSVLNFHLLPDLMEQIKSAIPETILFDHKDKIVLKEYFLVTTKSQTASTESVAEFRDIIRSVSEPIIALDAQIKCYLAAEHLSEFTREPSAFELKYRLDSIKISLARNTADNIKDFFSRIEEIFTLKSLKPEIRDDEDETFFQERTAFIAHSFDSNGKSYAYELIKFLNLLEFKVSTGEGFSPERVSKKVKDRLTAQEIVIVVVSQRDDVTWLIQEATGAAFSNKPLILLIEEGVEFKPGILGDIEYIKFPIGHIASAFAPILEGLHELDYEFGET